MKNSLSLKEPNGKMKILFKFPSRSRPKKFFNTIENIINLCVGADFKIIATLDVDDKVMNTPVVVKKIKGYKKLEAIWGNSENKIHAVNRDMDKIKFDWDICILQSDDMRWTQKGFDSVIRGHFKQCFPNTDGVLHYPDGSPAADKLCTLSILGKKYYERFGYLYHPDYKNVYCDQEFTDVAKKLGKYKYVDVDLYRHEHPAWGLAEKDELYIRNEEPVAYEQDHLTYIQRKKRGFDL